MNLNFGFKAATKKASNDMKPSEILKQAKELISDKSKHTTGQYARGLDGWNADPLSPEACKWCSIGAVIKVSGEDNVFSKSCKYLYYSQGHTNVGVTLLNDTKPHEEVMQMFDRAIELAISKGE